MPLSRRSLAASASALALPLLRPATAAAQSVARPARIILGFAAGGANDIIARVLAERLAGS
jgi:tripartite-type tricarboxylate transporter receptor subunit TctC